MNIVQTDRLNFSKVSLNNAGFLLKLMNDPDGIKFIGDRKILSIQDAENYISNNILKGYKHNGYGLFLVSEKESGNSAGICGLLKRDYLENPDIGFAFLPEYRGKGYAIESAAGILKYGKENFNMNKILAITQSNNITSIKSLSKTWI